MVEMHLVKKGENRKGKNERRCATEGSTEQPRVNRPVRHFVIFVVKMSIRSFLT